MDTKKYAHLYDYLYGIFLTLVCGGTARIIPT
jgi:hypothetical protein